MYGGPRSAQQPDKTYIHIYETRRISTSHIKCPTNLVHMYTHRLDSLRPFLLLDPVSVAISVYLVHTSYISFSLFVNKTYRTEVHRRSRLNIFTGTFKWEMHRGRAGGTKRFTYDLNTRLITRATPPQL